MNYLSLISIIGFGVCFSSPSFAQRGATYEGDAQAWESPTQGYPGYFDTNVADEGKFVLEFPPLIYGIIPMPSMALDYGVSKTLTVGTNSLVTTLPWLFGGQGLSLKARSLVYGTLQHQSAATVYAGYIGIQGNTPASVIYQNATWNHAWRFANSHAVTAHANYLRLSADIGKTNSISHSEISITTFLLGAGYTYTIDEAANLRGTVAATAYSSFDVSTPSADITQASTVKLMTQPNRIAQFQYEYHTRSDWLIGIGLIHLYVSGVSGTAPWLTFATRM